MKKIVLTIFITMFLLITNTNAATLTQRLGNKEVKMTIPAGEPVSLYFSSREGYQFKNWVIETGNLNIPTSSSNITFVMPDLDIAIRGIYDTHYTITYNANGGTGNMAVQNIVAGKSATLMPNKFTNGNATFKGWAKSVEGSTMYYDGDSIALTEDLQLYAVWDGPAHSDSIKVGDYVKYKPNVNTVNLTELTGFEHEVLHTAATENWKVLNVNSKTGIIEIISADSVTNLTLGVEASKSATGIYGGAGKAALEQSRLNYANAIYILNEISRAYEKEGVTSGSRGLGYNGTSVEEMNASQHEISYAATKGNENFVSGEPYVNNTTKTWKDKNILKDNDMMHSGNGYVWFASRNWQSGLLGQNKVYSRFSVRRLASSGTATHACLYGEYSDGSAESSNCTYGVRPIVSLKSSQILTGAGTKARPWMVSN